MDRKEMDRKEMDRKETDRKETDRKETDDRKGTDKKEMDIKEMGIKGRNRTGSLEYFKEMMEVGLPVTLQCVFQASYGLVDQLMVGKLGTVSIAGSGLGAKFSGLAMVTVSSVAAVASILVAQYHGAGEEEGKSRSFFYCLYIGLLVMILFLLPSVLVPEKIMGIYSKDLETVALAGKYLQIVGASFFPMTVTLMVSAYLRSSGQSRPPMYAGMLSMGMNVFLNYVFIFGKFGIPVMGLMGAGYGTLAARSVECVVLVMVMGYRKKRGGIYLVSPRSLDMDFLGKISVIVLPILLNEFSWSIGENIYAAVYGRMGTAALAATTLLNPLMGLFIGMFQGVSSAAGVMVGKRLGRNEREDARKVSKYLMKVGFVGSAAVAAILFALAGQYVRLFDIEPEVAGLAQYLVYALALVIFAKISNMILAGGILRSGGNTKYTFVIDCIGTWLFGVPLAYLGAFVWKLPVYWVYFILSQEEVVRLLIAGCVFGREGWMRNLTEKQPNGEVTDNRQRGIE